MCHYNIIRPDGRSESEPRVLSARSARSYASRDPRGYGVNVARRDLRGERRSVVQRKRFKLGDRGD